MVSEALAEQVTGFHVHRGALASLARTPLPSVDEVLDGARTVVVLRGRRRPHQRRRDLPLARAALGVDAVLLAPRCADPLYRRSVKVAMGAVFALPWTRLADWYDALPRPRAPRVHHGRADPGRRRRTRSRRPCPGSTGWPWCSGRRVTVCPSAGSASAERRAVIPMRAGIDSLNVAAATAVACYVASRSRIAPEGLISSYSVRVGWEQDPS